ncbi:MAG TPA: 5-formyltetrahydrofolate cyclo-ligase [Candidatus Omnitrophota bacterium]|nr:5-formyltetrahydrofolate cyclo-ligase [Candidatus Omnitrophota bacterium]
MIKEKKKEIRQVVLKKLKNHKEEERLKKSSKIAGKLFLLKEYLKAKTVLFYLSFDGEVDTLRMIKDAMKQGKKVAVPAILKEARELVPSILEDLDADLKGGPYGVLHPREEYIRPIPLEKIDLVIVPGLAFDVAGNRLGRGMGYYDRFLSRLPKDTPVIGLAFDFQIIDDFPPLEPHDLSVSKVLFA